MSQSDAIPKRKQTRGEEIANSILHGVGLTAALTAAPFLILRAVRQGDAGYIAGVSIFAATMVLLYLSSTLYHALAAGKAKRVFLIFDHSAIFLLIAGTYTPFTLGVLRGPWGWTLLGIIWGLAIAGVVMKSVHRFFHPVVSTGLYLCMGWLIVAAVKPLYNRMPMPGLLWLVAGGIAYTAGVAFYITGPRLRYGHAVWHVFVMAGTACHTFAVLWYAA